MNPLRKGETRRGRGVLLGLCLIVLFAVTAAGVALGLKGSEKTAAESTFSAAPGVTSVVQRETRATLDPARFVGKAAVGHQVARDIPDVLDQLYCYCECDKHAGHKSLLSCYTDGHAAT